MNNQTERQLLDKPEEYDYFTNPTVQTDPGFLSKFLFFNRLAMLYQYVTKISRERLFRYNDNFQPMISTNRILTKFSKSKRRHDPFSIAREIFRMEKRAMITLIILSVIAGLTSLVPIYFQFILVKAVMGNTGHYYSLGVVAGVMFARFILLNYVLNLSSNIALNIKIYMQNTFMRAVFACNSFSPSAKYMDVDLIAEAFYYIPYLITSQIIIIGDIVFVFLQVGEYGCIILGIYIIMYIAIFICGKVTYQILCQNSSRQADRQKIEKRALSGLIRIALERVHDYVFRLLVVEKTMETKQTLKINILYILAQTFGETCVILSNITLYALNHNLGIGFTSSYYSVLFMVACFYPFRYSVYGFFTIIKAYEAFNRVHAEFKDLHTTDLRSLPESEHQVHIFSQNVGDCFQYPYNIMQNQQQLNEIKGMEHQISSVEVPSSAMDFRFLCNLKDGQVMMVLTRVDSKPTIVQYLENLVRSKPSNKSLIMISSSHFMLPMSLRDNILFYSPFDESKFKKVLQIAQLNSLPNHIWSQTNLVDQKCLKFNEWHQSRIQLARALYNDVDYLILNKQNFFDDLSLLTAVFAQRKARQKITIVANNTYKYYFKLADRVLVIGRKGEMETGPYNQLRLERESLFNQMFLRHHEKVDHSARITEQKKDSISGTLHLHHKEGKGFHFQKSTFFEFFNFVHRKAEFIVIISLFLPVCFKYYLQYLIGTSVTVDILWRYLIFGLIYLVFIFNRGFVLAFYTNFSSLSLYRKICRKLKRLNAHQILHFYQKKNVDFDFHCRVVDRNLVMDFEYGQSILIEIMVSFIIYCTGQPLYITVAIPIIVGIVYINGYYAKNARAIYLLKVKETKGINRMVNTAVQRYFSISKCLKADEFNDAFHKENSIQIIYNCNIEWLQTGIRTLAELVVLICYVVFLIIMIYTVQNISVYTSLVSLGSSMFINLLYLNTFYLKAFRQMEISLYSLTLCMNFLKEEPNPTHRQILRSLEPQKIKVIEYVDTIVFRAITLNFFRKICDKITLNFEAGDRVVLSGNSNTYKEYIFYMLDNRLLDSQQIRGDILINGQILRQFFIDGLFFLHSDPILPFIGNIFEAVRYSKNQITQEQLSKQIQDFFYDLDLMPVFNINTQMDEMGLDQKELFEVFRVVIVQECKILVIISGFDNIDIVTRRKLTKWLLKRKQINIMIETTNVQEMVELYPKQYVFQKLKIRLKVDKDPSDKELILKRWNTGRQGERQPSSYTEQKEEKQFDSMLRVELEKQRQNDKDS